MHTRAVSMWNGRKRAAGNVSGAQARAQGAGQFYWPFWPVILVVASVWVATGMYPAVLYNAFLDYVINVPVLGILVYNVATGLALALVYWVIATDPSRAATVFWATSWFGFASTLLLPLAAPLAPLFGYFMSRRNRSGKRYSIPGGYYDDLDDLDAGFGLTMGSSPIKLEGYEFETSWGTTSYGTPTSRFRRSSGSTTIWRRFGVRISATTLFVLPVILALVLAYPRIQGWPLFWLAGVGVLGLATWMLYRDLG